MRRAHVNPGGRLQLCPNLAQIQIRLRQQNGSDCLTIHSRLRPRTVKRTIRRTRSLPRTGDVLRPGKAHAKLLCKLTQRALAQVVRLQQLPSQIVAISPSHPTSFNPHTNSEKNQAVYHQLISSSASQHTNHIGNAYPLCGPEDTVRTSAPLCGFFTRTDYPLVGTRHPHTSSCSPGTLPYRPGCAGKTR